MPNGVKGEKWGYHSRELGDKTKRAEAWLMTQCVNGDNGNWWFKGCFPGLAYLIASLLSVLPPKLPFPSICIATEAPLQKHKFNHVTPGLNPSMVPVCLLNKELQPHWAVYALANAPTDSHPHFASLGSLSLCLETNPAPLLSAQHLPARKVSS